MAVHGSPGVVEVEILAILSSNMESSVMLSGRAPGEKIMGRVFESPQSYKVSSLKILPWWWNGRHEGLN